MKSTRTRLCRFVLFIACATSPIGPARADHNTPPFDERFMALSAGPVLGWIFNSQPAKSGPTFGMEGGFNVSLFARLSVGGEVRPAETFAHAALEPWYLGGLTAGLGVGENSGHSPVLGAWAALPVAADVGEGGGNFVTVAAGYRWSGGCHQIYITPKAGKYWF